MERRAQQTPSLDFRVEGKSLVVEHGHLSGCTISYYKMDLEFLFSETPFLCGEALTNEAMAHFTAICPNIEEQVTLPSGDSQRTVIPVPPELGGCDVMVQITSSGLRKSMAHFTNTLRVRLMESYGQIKVTAATDGKPLPVTYVKCYRKENGRNIFHKDGYTDRRGRFDYATLSTGSLSSVQRFALFISSPSHGAVVKEASPPGT